MVSGIKNLNEIVFDEDIESHFSIRKIRSHLSSQLFWSGAEIVHQKKILILIQLNCRGATLAYSRSGPRVLDSLSLTVSKKIATLFFFKNIF